VQINIRSQPRAGWPLIERVAELRHDDELRQDNADGLGCNDPGHRSRQSGIAQQNSRELARATATPAVKWAGIHGLSGNLL
jgi:hypothetical protein